MWTNGAWTPCSESFPLERIPPAVFGRHLLFCEQSSMPGPRPGEEALATPTLVTAGETKAHGVTGKSRRRMPAAGEALLPARGGTRSRLGGTGDI